MKHHHILALLFTLSSSFVAAEDPPNVAIGRPQVVRPMTVEFANEQKRAPSSPLLVNSSQLLRLDRLDHAGEQPAIVARLTDLHDAWSEQVLSQE